MLYSSGLGSSKLASTVEMGTSSAVGGDREARPTLRHGHAESRSTGGQAVGEGSSHNDRAGEVSWQVSLVARPGSMAISVPGNMEFSMAMTS